ncbi:MAG: Ldh family oxidoreductase [Pseudomonadota bacterium]
MTTVSIALDKLEQLVITTLLQLGVEDTEARVVTDVLLYAEKRGSSQGLIKLKERTVLPDANCTPITTDNKTLAITTIDGGGHTGMYVLYRAMLAARQSVNACGIALVTTRNTRSSTGSISYYARALADKGYIGIVLAGSPKVMALQGGLDPVLGTNPIAIAIPTTGNSVIFDSATAAVTWFSVIHARDNQQLLPEHVAIDCAGKPTRDPVAAMQGALCTIAGAKGSGLALMFEFLTASLADASIVGDSHDNRGNTIICIDPKPLLDNNRFYTNADRLISRIKATRSAAADQALRLPGEASDARAALCEQHNSIRIDESLLKEIKALATPHSQ